MNRIIILLFCILVPYSIKADPHHVQALHPYCIGCGKEQGDKIFDEYLRKFNLPVNVDIQTYKGSNDPDSGVDWYIYIYVINESSPKHFALDISCPGTGMQIMSTRDRKGNNRKVVVEEGVTSIDEMIGSDPIRNNESAYIKNGSVIWPLDSSGGAQGMWFYSTASPINRTYQIVNSKGEIIREGMIKGPSCVEPFKQRVVTLNDKENLVFNGYAPFADLKATVIKSDWKKNADGHYVYSYNIESSINNIGDINQINIDIRCDGLPKDSYGYQTSTSGRKNNNQYQYGQSDLNYVPQYLRRRLSQSVEWWTTIKPGEKQEGYQIISTEPPIPRSYEFSPSFEKGYIIPQEVSYSDFKVTGMIEGPGCPGDDYNSPNPPATPLALEKQRKEQPRIQMQRRSDSDAPTLCIGKECLQ